MAPILTLRHQIPNTSHCLEDAVDGHVQSGGKLCRQTTKSPMLQSLKLQTINSFALQSVSEDIYPSIYIYLYLSLFLSPCLPFFTRPRHPSFLSQFWARLDLAVIDCHGVHPSPSWTPPHLDGRWRRRRRMKWRRRRMHGFIDAGAPAPHDASKSGSWWMMRPLGLRDDFILAGG